MLDYLLYSMPVLLLLYFLGIRTIIMLLSLAIVYFFISMSSGDKWSLTLPNLKNVNPSNIIGNIKSTVNSFSISKNGSMGKSNTSNKQNGDTNNKTGNSDNLKDIAKTVGALINSNEKKGVLP
ncbi:hypothetical protein [Candidatus Bandiella euplotis]|nr:hypothetical protein [Candidatus Bandiella woodruffii]